MVEEFYTYNDWLADVIKGEKLFYAYEEFADNEYGLRTPVFVCKEDDLDKNLWDTHDKFGSLEIVPETYEQAVLRQKEQHQKRGRIL